MKICKLGYQSILVQSYASTDSNHRFSVEIRPISGEIFPTSLLVECSKEMHTDYPLGTIFRICATLKQKKDSRPHLYSSYRWPFLVVSVPELNQISDNPKKGAA